MHVHITTIEFDLDGYVLINAINVEQGAFDRRASKRKTVDNGVPAVYDGGFNHGDQTIEYEFYPTEDQDEGIKYIVQNYGQVYVSTREGFYKVIPKYRPGYDRAFFSASILEKIA